jgi:hypothetical protein
MVVLNTAPILGQTARLLLLRLLAGASILATRQGASEQSGKEEWEAQID